MTSTRTDLPKITRFLSSFDSGEYGNTTCPHCGAKGRYVSTFLCDDGTRRAAMAGCIKLFPISPVAHVAQKLAAKERDYAKKEWSLPSWDQRKLDAIDRFYAGELDETQTMTVIRSEDQKAASYRLNRNRGRR